MFRIKICGITNLIDAWVVVRAGADAIGLNFYPGSPRYIARDKARQIIDVIPAEIVKTGVFVNATAQEICQTFDQLPLDLIQLHGDEPPEFIVQLGRRPVMRAFRLGLDGFNPVLEYLEQCKRLQCAPGFVLVDALAPGLYGGTGQPADWSICAQYPHQKNFPSLVLAGGLEPSNVAEAIRQVHPAAVDTASGVEFSPGQKDHQAVAEFVRHAREAFGIKT